MRPFLLIFLSLSLTTAPVSAADPDAIAPDSPAEQSAVPSAGDATSDAAAAAEEPAEHVQDPIAESDPDAEPATENLEAAAADAGATGIEPAGDAPAGTSAGDSTPDTASESVAREHQAQLARQMAEEEQRRARAAESVNAILRQEMDALTARTTAMEQFYTAQYDREIALYRDTIKLVITFGVAFAVIAGLGLLAAAFINYRALMAVQVVMMQRRQLATTEPEAGTNLLHGGENVPGMERVQASGQRFHSQVSSLDRRLSELENLASGRDHATVSSEILEGADSPAIFDDDEVVSEPPRRRVTPRAAILAHKAQAQMNLGRLDEALKTLDEAELLEEAKSEVFLARGKVLEKLGRLDDAINAYEEAARHDETNTNALLMKAGVLNRQERYTEALECYEQALAAHRLTV